MKPLAARRVRGSFEDRAVTVEFRSLIAKAATGAVLTRDEAAAAFEQMMSGEATPSQMGGLLMALRVRGESVEEITGAVSVMRAKMLRVHAPPNAIDVVGTGGDASGSFNISTCAALIVAGAGGARRPHRHHPAPRPARAGHAPHLQASAHAPQPRRRETPSGRGCLAPGAGAAGPGAEKSRLAGGLGG